MKKSLMVAVIAAVTISASPTYADEVPADFIEALGNKLLMCSVISLKMRRDDTAHVEAWTNRHYALKELAGSMYLDAGLEMTNRKFDMMFGGAVDRYVRLLADDKVALHGACEEFYVEADKLCRNAEAKCPYPAQR